MAEAYVLDLFREKQYKEKSEAKKANEKKELIDSKIKENTTFGSFKKKEEPNVVCNKNIKLHLIPFSDIKNNIEYIHAANFGEYKELIFKHGKKLNKIRLDLNNKVISKSDMSDYLLNIVLSTTNSIKFLDVIC